MNLSVPFRLVAVAALVSSYAAAADTPPVSVTIAGSLDSELGCPADWDPGCALAMLGYDASDGVWQATFVLPAGSYEYKAALNGTWDENYGLNATRDGANIPLSLAADSAVKFFYDPATHWVTSNANSVIATVAGSFQSELGCSSDWDPACLRSWLEDPDGDGTYAFEALLPAGSYEAKVAIDESWDENYGAGGEPNGPNIPFVTDGSVPVVFRYVAATHVLTITTYDFSGFFPPVENPDTVNTAKAGKVIAVKFSLGGDQGLDIFAAGSPTSTPISCDSEAVEDVVEETVTAFGGGLVYDASTDQYAYLWKTDRRWGSTCRELVIVLADGSVHTALFHFTR